MKYPKIAKKINEITVRDQETRRTYDKSNWQDESLRQKMLEIDKESTTLIKNTVKEIGYPTISKVGEKASFNTWLLIQHSMNLEFMLECLKQMQANKDDVNPQNIAYLKDRTLMMQKKPQVYGTQMRVNKETRKP